jgi:hypothetical protein
VLWTVQSARQFTHPGWSEPWTRTPQHRRATRILGAREQATQHILRRSALRLSVPRLAHFRAAAPETLSAGAAFLARAVIDISVAGQRAV